MAGFCLFGQRCDSFVYCKNSLLMASKGTEIFFGENAPAPNIMYARDIFPFKYLHIVRIIICGAAELIH